MVSYSCIALFITKFFWIVNLVFLNEFYRTHILDIKLYSLEGRYEFFCSTSQLSEFSGVQRRVAKKIKVGLPGQANG